MANTYIGTIYAGALRNTRALEKQGLERYPKYAAVLRRHVETTKAQIDRLDRALGDVGESPSSLKETVTSVAGSRSVVSRPAYSAKVPTSQPSW